MPSAGKMRPNTSVSGIFNTKRSSPVSTSMLTRMLVPKPKNAFQSPTVQSAGRDVAVVITRSPIDCIQVIASGVPGTDARRADLSGVCVTGSAS
jgi:hypothetical protein